MSNVSERLNELNIHLPEPPIAAGSYLPVVRSGQLLFISGNLPIQDGKLFSPGVVGDSVDIEFARKAARISAINILANTAAYLGSIDEIKQIVKVTGFVASAFGFTDQPKVINGASDLFVEIFGEAGRHARSAIGVSALPLGSCVEVEAIIEI